VLKLAYYGKTLIGWKQHSRKLIDDETNFAEALIDDSNRKDNFC
jgi:hypothetical protein